MKINEKDSSFMLDYNDFVAYVFGGMVFITLILLAVTEDWNAFLYLFECDIKNQSLILLLIVPLCYVVGCLIQGFVSFLVWIDEKILKRKPSLWWIFAHREYGQRSNIFSPYDKDFDIKEDGTDQDKFDKQNELFDSKRVGSRRFFSIARLLEIISLSSLIAIILELLKPSCQCHHVAVFVVIFVLSYIQSVYYWHRYVAHKVRKIVKNKA